MGLGDIVEKALSKVGVTEERVTRWLGRPCGCRRRKEKLNALGQWAARLVTGQTPEAEGKERLGNIIDDGEPLHDPVPEQEPAKPEPPNGASP